ncbi:unnamed protein product [Laminaria digitata]
MGRGGETHEEEGDENSNHDPECRVKYGGLAECPDVAGVNLTPHLGRGGGDRSRQNPECSPSVSSMELPNFTYSVRVMNELENGRRNRHYLSQLLSSVPGHAPGGSAACLSALWSCGRCFCSSPVMRVFDCFGRVDIVFLGSALAVGEEEFEWV